MMEDLWHFYYVENDPYCDREIREAYCGTCQPEFTKEHASDRLVVRAPEPGESCDGCGISAVEVEEE